MDSFVIPFTGESNQHRKEGKNQREHLPWLNTDFRVVKGQRKSDWNKSAQMTSIPVKGKGEPILLSL